MQFIRSIHKIQSHHQNSVVTIGNFDGVHLGHQHLMRALNQKARAVTKPSMVITFEPLPGEYFSPEKPPARLTSLREKLFFLKKLHVDYVLCLKFDHQLVNLPAKKFIHEILNERIKINHLIVGEDFRFGQGREGDTTLLSELSEKNGFTIEIIQKIQQKSEWISSTRIRKALRAADFDLAKQLLGRSYTLQGRVAHGQKLARTLGFPTANIDLHGIESPLSGVFVVQAFGLGEKPVFGVANIGQKPTLRGLKKLLEVYLFDFHETIYGRHIVVMPLKKIRDEKKFPDVAALSAQISKDVILAQTLSKQFL